MGEKEIIDNLQKFIEVTVIYPGHGFEYRRALQHLIQGYSYDEVIKWYNTQVGVEDGN